MILTENYIQRLKNLAGIDLINEADNRQIIKDKIKLPGVIADWAHNLSDKYSIWIANTFRGKYLTDSTTLGRMDGAVKEEILRQIINGKAPLAIVREMQHLARLYSGHYTYILDWLRGRNNPPVRETDKLDFGTLTYDDAMRRAQAWHMAIEKLTAGEIKDEDGKVVLTFPDGFYWINLGKSYCEKEAQSMGHCARANGILYSLRKDKHPFITVDLADGVIKQIKGRANTKPKPEYYPYILAFIMDNKIGVEYLESSYRPETDFNINDLTDEQLIDIANKKPSLFQSATEAAKRLPIEVFFKLLKKVPGMMTEKTLEETLSDAQMKEMFADNPQWTDSVYLQAKYRGYEGVKGIKKGTYGGFEPDGVEIMYDDWTDPPLLNLFDDPKQAGEVANWEVDFYGYDYQYDDTNNYLGDFKPETIAYVKYLLKKAFTSESNISAVQKKSVTDAIQKTDANKLYYLMRDPDTFIDLHGIESYNEHIIDTLKGAYVAAVEDAQRSADEGEYWKLFTKPVEDLLGKPTFKEAKIKSVDKKTGKMETRDHQFLRFKISYPEFLALMKDSEEYDNYGDEGNYTTRMKDGMDPTDIVTNALKQREESLKIKEPYNGVSGDIDEAYVDERFSEKMHEDLSDELAKAKVVVKKKKKV